MGVSSMGDLIIQPWVGFSWEGFVIEQILICLEIQDKNYEAYYFRTGDGYELDLVLKIDGEIWAFEIKLSSAPGKRELDGLKKTSEMIGVDKMALVSRTKKEIKGTDIISTNIDGILKMLSSK